MLFRLDNPRLVMNAQEFPENLVLYCLAYAGCAGDVAVNFVDLQTSRLITQSIQPTRSLPIFEGFSLNEHVVPFDQLVDSRGRLGSISGFTVIGRSSYRVAGADYQVRTLELTLIFPINGGGIIRIRAGEQEWDIANPTFNPHARIPPISNSYSVGVGGNEYVSGPPGINNERIPDDVLINSYQRTHRGFVGQAASALERRRQERLANFDLNESVGTSRMDPVEQPQSPIPARQGPTNVVTGRTRQVIETPVEQRDIDQLTTLWRGAELPGQLGMVRNHTVPLTLGEDQNRAPANQKVILPATREPKEPPKTRYQRIQENCEEPNEPKE